MKKTANSPKRDSKTRAQVDAFREKAKEIGADGDVNVDDVMRRLAKQPRRDQSSRK